ncbi:MAG: hypothetical protein HKN23_07815 [Verrucomicrobiales bacterium]|nr:hypothetical protein [Verrucomicrobiales bacterium]
MKTNLPFLTFHLLPWLGVAGAGLVFGLGKRDSLAGAIFASQITGYAALACLLVSLATGPFFRDAAKHVGLLSAELALLHAGVSLWLFLDFRWSDLLYRVYLRAGVAAFGLLVVIYAVSQLRRRMEPSTWRAFFVFGHLAAGLALIHAATSPFAGGLRLVITAATVLSLIILLKLAKLLFPGRKSG